MGSTPTIGTTNLVSSNVYKVFLLFRQFTHKTFGCLCLSEYFYESLDLDTTQNMVLYRFKKEYRSEMNRPPIR